MNCDGDENCHSWDWSLHTQAFRECPWSIGASAQIQVCLVLKKNHNNCKPWTPNRRWKRVVLLACFFRKNPGPTNSTIGMIRNSGTPHIENIPMPLRNLDIWTSFCPRLALRAKKAKLFKMRRYVFKSHVSILFPDWLHLEVVFERLILLWFLWWHAFLWNFKNINNKKQNNKNIRKHLLSTMAMLGVPILISFVNLTICSWLSEQCRTRDTSLAGSSTSKTSCLLLSSSVTSSWATESCTDVERVVRKDCGCLFNAGSKEEEAMRLGFRTSRRCFVWKWSGRRRESFMGDFEENVFAFSMISIMEFIHDFSKNYIIYLGHVAIHGGVKIMDYILYSTDWKG